MVYLSEVIISKNNSGKLLGDWPLNCHSTYMYMYAYICISTLEARCGKYASETYLFKPATTIKPATTTTNPASVITPDTAITPATAI